VEIDSFKVSVYFIEEELVWVALVLDHICFCIK
jgi:hypothetical protein